MADRTDLGARRRPIGSAALRLLAVALLVVPARGQEPARDPAQGPAPNQAKLPSWIGGSFVERKWEPSAAARSLALLDDGESDLRLVDHDGRASLHLLQPGTIVSGGSYLRGSPFRKPEELVASLTAGTLGALHFEIQPGGDPYLLQPELRIETGSFAVVRTLRQRQGGGGALAVLTCRDLVLPPAGTTRASFDVAVLALDPEASRVPRLDESLYATRRGTGTGLTRLFSTSHWHSPVLSTFDVLRLDRDHLEWNGGRPRDVELIDDDRLAVPDGSGAELRAVSGDEMRFPPQPVLARSAMPLASSSNFFLHASDLGFDRVVRCSVSTYSKKMGLLEFRWRDVKADAIVPPLAAGHDVVVLDEAGEPVAGAWVYARSAATGAWPPPGLFAVESDIEGRARVPIRTGDDPRAVEVVAFEAGARGRFGARRGAIVEAGTGGECVVLVDRVESTPVRIEPAPEQAAWAGLVLDGAAVLVPVAEDGTLVLPALARTATLRIGRPWVAQSIALPLVAAAAGAPSRIAAKFAAPLERRVRLMGASDGVPIDRAQLEEIEPEGAVSFDHGTALAGAEFAGQEVRAKVVTRDFEPFELVIAADAPRDRDQPLKRRGE
jgi:hypothetical protein